VVEECGRDQVAYPARAQHAKDARNVRERQVNQTIATQHAVGGRTGNVWQRPSRQVDLKERSAG